MHKEEMSMERKIDELGRVLIPIEMRRMLGIEADWILEISENRTTEGQ